MLFSPPLYFTLYQQAYTYIFIHWGFVSWHRFPKVKMFGQCLGYFSRPFIKLVIFTYVHQPWIVSLLHVIHFFMGFDLLFLIAALWVKVTVIVCWPWTNSKWVLTVYRLTSDFAHGISYHTTFSQICIRYVSVVRYVSFLFWLLSFQTCLTSLPCPPNYTKIKYSILVFFF